MQPISESSETPGRSIEPVKVILALLTGRTEHRDAGFLKHCCRASHVPRLRNEYKLFPSTPPAKPSNRHCFVMRVRRWPCSLNWIVKSQYLHLLLNARNLGCISNRRVIHHELMS